LKIAIISDTHRQHRSIVLPDEKDIDCLIHCGDITANGESSTIEDFADWLKSLPYKHKLITAGNHDRCFERRDYGGTQHLHDARREEAIELLQNAGATYLEHEHITIDGVKMFFSPFTPTFFNWAFNVNRGKDLAEKWAAIDDDVVVLCTHGVPYGLLDEAPRGFMQTEHVGCEELRKVIDSGRLKKLKLVCGGHIHNSSGTMDYNGIKIINAAICGENYKPTNPVRIIEI
jgi:Icc-related predicted phosphoesterase